ncbi:MAG: corrinoid protein [Anaerolineaceae bacterium]|nr:corrinoid protein [Anaerolineaceae bacterium]
MSQRIESIYDSVLEGQQKRVITEVEAALAEGLDPESILNDGMVAAMSEVGQLFEEGEFFVPEMLIAARAMQAGLTLLKPHLAEANVQSAGKIAIGTVKGDLHDIGKNLVAMMLEGSAFEVIDLGTDVPAEAFVETVRDQNIQILALSALLTTSMPNMKVVIDALEESGLRGRVKIIVGGAPVNHAYAAEIGADGYSPDASQAVTLAKQLLQQTRVN